VALQRYQADPSDAAEATPAAEQERWEAEQQKRTRLGGGNREVLAEAAAAEAEKYEMLFDDSIEYVKVRGALQVTSAMHDPPLLDQKTPQQLEDNLRR
jgi:hypothetical protein